MHEGLTKRISPYDENFRQLNEKLEVNKSIMLRFDEVITEKASKVSLDSVLKIINDQLGSKRKPGVKRGLVNKHEYEQQSVVQQIKLEENKQELDRISKIMSELNFTVETEIK